jgi:uncharacterized protein with ParB-like and HNH nuclease domain
MSVHIEDVVSSRVVALLQVFQNASAFVIPAYQRSYSWDKDQVRKLITDMYTGLCALGTSASPNEEYRFLGTIITVEKSGTFVNYGLHTPNQFQEIVDGQQRITTLALIGIQLEKMIREQLNLVLSDNTYVDEHEEVKSIVEEYCKNLQAMYMTTSQNSRVKLPRIIREEIDRWQEGGYKSVLSNVVMNYIYEDKYRLNANIDNDLVIKNMYEIKHLLNHIMIGSETFNTDNGENTVDEFVLDIRRILTSFPKRILWDRPNCQFDTKAIDEHDTKTSLNGLVRLLLFAYYLKNKCVINYISAKKEDWAFDMFVSLNTTGVPLTAVETFRANLLVQVKNLNPNSDIKNNLNRQIIDLYTNNEYGVQSYFDKEPDTEKKTKKTKEFVTTFALAYDGTKLGYDLQRQRIWLRDSLNQSIREVSHKSSRERSDAIQVYMSRIRHMLKFLMTRDALISKEIQGIDDLQSTPNADLAMLCLCFLNDVNHSIVNALLSRFYERLQSKKEDVQSDFVDSVLAVTAFFVLWRSVRGTSGLPEVYREGMSQFFSFRANSEDAEFQLNIKDVKKYLRSKLTSYVDGKNLLDKSIWVAIAERELRFRGMKDLCRFVIFISLNNTTKDIDNPGLIVNAMNGFANWADQDSWHSQHYATIEHIAPQNPGKNSDWDTKLYDERDLFDRIGNLALLPTSINSAVGNNAWTSKWIYYSHLAEANPQNLAKLNDLAKASGLLLRSRTIKLLCNTKFNYHMEPIVYVGIDGKWDADLVEKRTTRMLEIFHDRMLEWLQ